MYETGSAIISTGALTAYSGAKTGRSPLDKRIVQEESSEKDIWWGPVNKPMSPQVSRTRSMVEMLKDGDGSSASAFGPRESLLQCGATVT